MSPRPKEFEKDAVLDAAMKVFWEKGYEAASLQDLVDGMGINRFSIYESFGSKHKLFMAACKHYRELMDAQRLRPLREDASGIPAIREFLLLAIGPAKIKGCLMTNSIVELSLRDKAFKSFAEEFLILLEESFYAALKRAKQKGELRSTHNLRELAGYLTSFAQGLGVTGKASDNPRKLHRAIDTALAQL